MAKHLSLPQPLQLRHRRIDQSHPSQSTRRFDHAYLGRSGLAVSTLVLGTINFGEYTTEPSTHLILDRAIEHGINFVDTIDTANMYGGPPSRSP